MSSAYNYSNQSRMTAESIGNLIVGQIRQATSQPKATWITQPGLIRTFLEDGSVGPAYKLYSSNVMIAAGGFDPEAALNTEVPGDWPSRPDQFFDLNRPIKNATGQWIYPILNPAAEGVIEGFKNLSAEKQIAAGTAPAYTAPSAKPLPMPVRWLYELEDGTLAAQGDDGKIPGTSASNPPVARLAFWTDDETCKINLNTASSGMYWDAPRGRGNNFEKGDFATGAAGSDPIVAKTGLAASPPGQGEYNRYPGHPATTSLDVVLSNTAFFTTILDDTERRKKILSYSPRIRFGGSKFGSAFPQKKDAIVPGSERLYATIDEYFYSPNRSPNNDGKNGILADKLDLARFFLTTNSRSPEATVFNTPRVTIWPMPRNKADRTPYDTTIAFCSSIGGREYLFTRGKFLDGAFSLSSNNTLTGASTIPALNPTMDFTTTNSEIYDYLYHEMQRSIPGYGASLQDKFQGDTSSILTLIYDYIRSTNLYDLSAPNSAPYTSRPFLQNELVKYLGVPTAGASHSSTDIASLARPSYSDSSPATYYHHIGSAYVGQVVPINITRNGNTTRGLGRFPVITGATLVLFATDPVDMTLKYEDWKDPQDETYAKHKAPTAVPEFASFSPSQTPPVPAHPASKIQAFLLFSVATPSAGALGHAFSYDLEVTGLDGAQLTTVNELGSPTTVPMGFPPLAINRVASGIQGTIGLSANFVQMKGVPNWGNPFTYAAMKTLGEPSLYNIRSKTAITPATGDNAHVYPFVSAILPINGSPTVSFGDVTMNVTIKVDNNSLQTYTIKLPAFTAPAPKWALLGKEKINSDNTVIHHWYDSLVSGRDAKERGRLLGLGGDTRYSNGMNIPFAGEERNLPTLILPYDLDVVRGVELVHGDFRLIGGTPIVPETEYQKCDGYDDSSRFQACNLILHPKSSFGRLTPGNAPEDILPKLGLPSRLTAALRKDGKPGDWDAGMPFVNGYGDGWADSGPYINKADDGAFGYRANSTGTPVVPYFRSAASLVMEQNAYTPNRILPSAVMFGSLPVGVVRGLPWQTLLFRPDYPSHPGASSPPDHLVLDLFAMPTVEPYPISEPFSTDGKVNLNFQIAPFTYIKRDTALRAVLHATRLFAVPATNAYLNVFDYAGTTAAAGVRYNYRYPINRDATMKLFEDRLASNKPFLTASAICEMPLVPKPESLVASGIQPQSDTPFQATLSDSASVSVIDTYLKNFWDTWGNGTADNLRERPYTTIYPRVTARSNTFTVHMCVQRLKRSPSSEADTFNSSKGGQITSEYRGSVSIERFLDANNTDFEIDQAGSQLGPYLFRVTNFREFSP